MDKLYVDINIVVDFLAKREPFYRPAAALFQLGLQDEVQLGVSANIFPFLFYLLTKQDQSRNLARTQLLKFRPLVTILPVGETVIDAALRSEMPDLEDAIQYELAMNFTPIAIITRNVRDFKNAELPVLTAADYLTSRGIIF